MDIICPNLIFELKLFCYCHYSVIKQCRNNFTPEILYLHSKDYKKSAGNKIKCILLIVHKSSNKKLTLDI